MHFSLTSLGALKWRNTNTSQMEKNMKKYFLATIAFLLFGLSLTTLAAEVNLQKEVILQKVDTISLTSRNGSRIHDTFSVLVENLSFQKALFIHANLNGTWTDIPMQFEKSVGNGKEMWKLRIDRGVQYNLEFAVKYQVNGKVFWDNNNNQNFLIDSSEGRRLFGINVLAAGDYSVRNYFFHSTITVKNLGPTKQVDVIYSTDNWATTKVAYAVFDRSHPGYENEEWTFDVDVSGASEIKYAISYQVNGVTYWDNNFGRNYFGSFNL
jgi:hypothetical protein